MIINTFHRINIVIRHFASCILTIVKGALERTVGKILFFDGVCVLCNGLVDFALKHDHKKEFTFASLQGQTAHELIPAYTRGDLYTVVLVDGPNTYVESDAIIHLFMGFGGIFRIACMLRIIPKKLRDYLYRFVSKNRYRWFGKKASCRLPLPEEKERIID
jgi:predicted DCC family thiol-disulfide oxidoreductase YuxK